MGLFFIAFTFVVIVALMTAAALLIPKGPQQVFVFLL